MSTCQKMVFTEQSWASLKRSYTLHYQRRLLPNTTATDDLAPKELSAIARQQHH